MRSISREKNKKNILAISGSVRPENMTTKVLKSAVHSLRDGKNGKVVFLSPTLKMLILPGQRVNREVLRLQKMVKKADGIVLATPEYNGSYSSVIKLVIENLEHPHLFKGKPVAIIGVGIGQIGAVKAIEHLSSVCHHVGAIVVPGAVSVAHVDKKFNDKGECLDENLVNRLNRLMHQLTKFID